MPILDHWKARSATWLALRGVPEARGLRLGRVLKNSPETAVFEATLNGRPVVVKRTIGVEASMRTGAQADELAVQHPLMCEGAFRVPEPILALPGQGIMVMEHAPGLRFDAVLRADPARRPERLRQAGEWLAHYTRTRRVEDAFGGGYWIKTRGQAMQAMPAGPDRERVAALIGLMERERARVGPCPITRARSHGDFCTLNLMVDGDAIWGVDIQNDTWIALAKDLARFLVYLEITLPQGETDGPCGLSDADAQALLGTPGLIRAGEIETMLPFFTAVEMSGRLMSESAWPGVMMNARALADRMLDAG